MTSQVQKRRGTTTEHSTFTGAEGEITVDTTKDTAVVHDGVTTGGRALAREDLNNVAASDIASKLNGTALSGVDINSGAIDGSIIGGTTPAAGSFTSLTATGTSALTTVDIDGGAIDGTTIGASSPTTGVFTTLQANTSLTSASVIATNLSASGTTTLAGASTTADITFGDNDKAIFGAGSDLQIYHNGSNSFIDNTGTGSLIIQDTDGTGDILLRPKTSQLGIGIYNDDRVDLCHSGSVKLSTTPTGVDVTGTATMDGLTVDGTGSVVGLQILDDTASTVEATWTHVGATGTSTINVGRNSTWGGELILQTDAKNRANFASNGDISFYEDTGTTAKMVWSAASEQLDIDGNLIVNATATTGDVHITTGNDTNGDGESGVGFWNQTYSTTSVGMYPIRGGAGSFFGNGLKSHPTISGSLEATYPFYTGIVFENNTVSSSKRNMKFLIASETVTVGNEVASPTEAMRIDSSGNIMAGVTSALGAGDTGLYYNGSLGVISLGRTGTGTATKLSFFNDNGSVGSISTVGTSTAYNTSSDYRLKEDWQPVANAITDVKALKPCNFAWKADGTRVNGFLAHELAEVIPEAVTGEKDAVDDEGNPVYQGIDQSKLVPLLTAALQEAIAKIETLEQRLTDAGL